MAPHVATFPGYGPAMRDHLLMDRLRHWDPDIRALASRGLAALIPTDQTFFRDLALSMLTDLCTHQELEVRKCLHSSQLESSMTISCRLIASKFHGAFRYSRLLHSLLLVIVYINACYELTGALQHSRGQHVSCR